MKLNINFNPSLEEVINLCDLLADWFERNQEIMAYFEMTHKGCLHFQDNPMANNDVVVLGRMANAALTWIESSKEVPFSPEEKALNAAIAINIIYEEEKERLSDRARVQYYIDIEGLQKNETEEKTLKRRK